MFTRAESTTFTVYVIHAFKWKQFLVYDLIGGFAFYLVCKKTMNSELFGLAANLAGPQMLKYVLGSFRT